LLTSLAACAAAGPSAAAPRVNVNACSYSATAPVATAVRSLDAKGVVTFQRACRVTIRLSTGGAPAVVLGGAAYPANQYALRLQLARSGENDDETTRNVVTRVPRLKNAYLVREIYVEGGELARQTILLKLATKMIVLENYPLVDETNQTTFLRPVPFYAVARLVR
jgi:hypothetical protein